MSITAIQPIFEININGAPISNLNFESEIEIQMNCSSEPDFFIVKIFNVDQLIQNIIIKGAIVSLTLGYKTGLKNLIITGIITNIDRYEKDGNWITQFKGIDYVIYKLKQTKINLSLNTPKDIISIIDDIALKSGVKLSSDSVPSGVILPNYTINNKIAYSSIIELSNRIKFNVTSKLSKLYVTSNIISNITGATLTDELGYIFDKSSGINQNSDNKIEGLSFEGNGIPILTPMKIINVNSVLKKIVGTYVLESITHIYDSSGYRCIGNLIGIETNTDVINIISQDLKSIATTIVNKINNIVNEKISVQTGIVEREFNDNRTISAKIGINNEKNKSIVNKSIESPIGENNVIVNEKPLMSIFTGNGYGLLVPSYRDSRCLLVHNNSDSQDINIIGFLWDKNWIIPDHDKGDFMIHHLNHSKFVMKEDGSKQIQAKSLKIEIGNNGLTISKPTKSNDGDLEIVFDNGDKLSYVSGNWTLQKGTQKITMGTNLVIENGSKITISASGVDVT